MGFPDWLPEHVQHEIVHYASATTSEREKQLLRKLALDPRMQPVWETLSKYATRPETLLRFLSSVMHTLDYWRTFSQRDLLLTPKQRQTRIQSIINAIDDLQSLLKENVDLIVDYSPDALNPIDDELLKIRRNLKRYSLFWDSLPTKMSAGEAERTFFAKQMKQEVERLLGRPCHRVVADVTTVVFDTEISEDHIRKL